jgi:ribosomal protein L11 methylase PrmA
MKSLPMPEISWTSVTEEEIAKMTQEFVEFNAELRDRNVPSEEIHRMFEDGYSIQEAIDEWEWYLEWKYNWKDEYSFVLEPEHIRE